MTSCSSNVSDASATVTAQQVIRPAWAAVGPRTNVRGGTTAAHVGPITFCAVDTEAKEAEDTASLEWNSDTSFSEQRDCPCSGLTVWRDEAMAPRISLSVTEVKDTNSKVFVVDVWVSGRHHQVERRYTEFEELHKQIKKMMKTPEFPPKKVLKWNSKVLEQRQRALEVYLQGVVSYEAIPKAVLEFLEIKFDNEGMDFDKGSTTSYIPSHQAVVTFPQEAYLQDVNRGTLPDIIAEGVMIGLFDSDYTAFPS